jgi:glycosyltransferase involved in cell wall biosynthesis
MRILCIAPTLGTGGAERQWSVLLPGLRARGHDARVITLDDGGPFVAQLRDRDVPVDVVGMRSQADLVRVARCPLVRCFTPEVVLTRGVNGLYIGHLLARWRAARHVYNDHIQVGFRLSPRREALVKWIAPRLDRVIAVADGQGRVWQHRGLDPARFVVIDNGIEVPEVAEPRDRLREELGVAPTGVVALLVAALRPEKRVPDFVQAVRQARAERPELVGIIAGDGADRPAVESAIDGDPGVRLLGYRDDVARLLKASDVFALSSAFEAAPMAILEAMACGLPVLATDVGGVRELVVDRETGVLVPAADTAAMARELVALAGDEPLRRALGAAGRERQRARWNAEAMVGAYEAALSSVVGRGGPTG